MRSNLDVVFIEEVFLVHLAPDGRAPGGRSGVGEDEVNLVHSETHHAHFRNTRHGSYDAVQLLDGQNLDHSTSELHLFYT